LVLIDAPAVVAEMSNVPPVAPLLKMNTPLDEAIEPVPARASVPASIVVAPE